MIKNRVYVSSVSLDNLLSDVSVANNSGICDLTPLLRLRIADWHTRKTQHVVHTLFSNHCGIDYVKSLHAIMSYNKLNDADQAYLWDKGKIVVSPAP